MFPLRLVWAVVHALFAKKAGLVAENLALRQQLIVFRRKVGRPAVAPEVRNLIRRMSRANPLWGAPRIHGELLKLGIDLFQTTVAKYMIRHRKPPSPSWRAFLDNHLKLSRDRRRIVHFNVTEHPSVEWTGRQLVGAFPWDTVPRYLIRDRDGIHGRSA